MLIFGHLHHSRKLILILDLLKISFITFVAFSLVAQMFPYFNGLDSADYGITAKILAHGSWGFSNELLQKTGLWEFVPWTWSKSVTNEAVPLGSIGIHGLAASAYLVGGEYGLFYLGPLFSILLIITIERISFNLFGRFVSFFAVVLTGTSWAIIGYGVQLYSDNIFTFFFIIGIYFLIKFFYNKKEFNILLSSTFLVAASFVRSNGVVSFPLEVVILAGSLYLPFILKNHFKFPSNVFNNFYSLPKNKRNLKLFFYIFVPWLFFFSVIFAYNSYYFGDPFLSQYDVRPSSNLEWSLKNTLKNFSTDFFQWFSYCSSFLLPDKLLSSLPGIENIQGIDPYNHTWVGVLSLLILFSGFLISIFTKCKRVEITILCFFILATIGFYSLAHMSRIPNLEQFTPRSLAVTDPKSSIRYMLPAFPLFFICFGFALQKIWKIKEDGFSKSTFTTFHTIIRYGFLVIVISFLITSFYDSSTLQGLIHYGVTDPQKELNKYLSINREELPQRSVIVGFYQYSTNEYGAIPFFPYWGFDVNRIDINPELIPQKPIGTLKQLLLVDNNNATVGAKSVFNELPNYQIFVLKNHMTYETSYYHYLESNHGIILKDYSNNFCKMVLVELNQNNTDQKGDQSCY